ncbi:hypothetical protein [Gilvimarinus xylanilyticus]|nr:hypothetical protein [Gilvimarinus xylanilyticus]
MQLGKEDTEELNWEEIAGEDESEDPEQAVNKLTAKGKAKK